MTDCPNPNAGSSFHVSGFHQVDTFNSKREHTHRMGTTTILPSIDCSKPSTNNQTSDVCKQKMPGYALMMDAHWDRHTKTSCSRN